MSKSSITLCLLLIAVGFCVPCAAQTAQPAAPPESVQRSEDALSDALDQVKAVDEPTLRVFLRLRIATSLWRSSYRGKVKVETVASEAVVDLQNNIDKVPASYANWFRRDLLAQLSLHAPAVAAGLTKEYELNEQESRTQVGVASAMLDSKGGADSAVKLVSGSLAQGAALDPALDFFLLKLKEKQPAALTPLLTQIVAVLEQRPAAASVDALFRLKHFYVASGTPREVQERYLAVTVGATREAASGGDQREMEKAYNLLQGILPALADRQPALFAAASQQAAALTTRLPRAFIEQADIYQRVRQAANPLDQLIVEANATKDESVRARLLAEAAQLAHAKDQPQLALELVTKIRLDSSDSRMMWRDQFLADIVGRALDGKNVELARKAATHINSALNRSAALQKIALHNLAAGDSQGAQSALAEAQKLITSAADDDVNKVVALFNLSAACFKVDEPQAFGLAQAAVSLINKGAKPEANKGANPGGGDIEAKMKVASSVIPAFRTLATKDSAGALSLAQTIQYPELKAPAFFGASMGASVPAGASSVARKQ
jgi:hypothetical protein